MNRMTPDLARLLVEERVGEAERRWLRRARAAAAPQVPQQRRGRGLLARIVPRTGVRADTR